MTGSLAGGGLRIVVLQHEGERPLGDVPYRMPALASLWSAAGHDVRVQRGIAERPEADVVIAHVDLTLLPPSYVAWLKTYPRAVNAGAIDLSKRVVSRLLVAPNDGYAGPVIVKTNLNYGGLPEQRVAGGRPETRGWRRLFYRPSPLARARWLSPLSYPIFDRVTDLPTGVFDNPALVVERFVPERVGTAYAIRAWTFLGNAEFASRVLGPKPIVKPGAESPREPCEVPQSVREVRTRLGLDYGKIDFVMHEGEAHVLDATRTPGLRTHGSSSAQDDAHRTLAHGLGGLVDPRI